VSGGFTFDTGALIGLERRGQRVSKLYRDAVELGQPVTVPAVALAEWWRGRSVVRARILAGVRVEPMDSNLAQLAGEALAHVRGATVIDAIVMASAARRGDVLYTSDFEDMDRLRAHFPSVRVLRA
jgi:predicted nucleic acid-binding protein